MIFTLQVTSFVYYISPKPHANSIHLEIVSKIITNLGSERTRGWELLTDKITGGDMRNTEEIRETRSVGSFSDAWTAEKHPLNISITGISLQRKTPLVVVQPSRRFQVNSLIRRRRRKASKSDGHGRERCGASESEKAVIQLQHRHCTLLFEAEEVSVSGFGSASRFGASKLLLLFFSSFLFFF